MMRLVPQKKTSDRFRRHPQPPSMAEARRCLVLSAAALAASSFTHLRAQQPVAPVPSAPVIVQPGAPGEPTKTLPSTTHGILPQLSHDDITFMQGMIMHHSQAVEMTALIESHTQNKYVRSIGAKISSSQSDEIRFMQRWLIARGQATTMSMPEMSGMDMSHHDMSEMPPMPGMLTKAQMEALRNARGAEFDHLFLT